MPGWYKPMFARRAHYFVKDTGLSLCKSTSNRHGDVTDTATGVVCQLCLLGALSERMVFKRRRKPRKLKPRKLRGIRARKVSREDAAIVAILRKAVEERLATPAAQDPPVASPSPVMSKIGPCETDGCTTKFTQYRHPVTGKRCCLRCLGNSDV